MGGGAKVVRLPEGDQTTDFGRERRQGCDRLHRELVHLAAEPAERPTHPLPRRQSRVAVPIFGTLCTSCFAVLVRIRRLVSVNINEFQDEDFWPRRNSR